VRQLAFGDEYPPRPPDRTDSNGERWTATMFILKPRGFWKWMQRSGPKPCKARVPLPSDYTMWPESGPMQAVIVWERAK
jgi:hypothetical protein